MIYAASILGAKKVHLSALGIGWRTHEGNDSKKLYTTEDVVIRECAIRRAFDWYCTKYDIPRYPEISEFFSEYKKLSPYWQTRLDLPSKYRMLNRLVRSSIKQFFKITN